MVFQPLLIYKENKILLKINWGMFFRVPLISRPENKPS